MYSVDIQLKHTDIKFKIKEDDVVTQVEVQNNEEGNEDVTLSFGNESCILFTGEVEYNSIKDMLQDYSSKILSRGNIRSKILEELIGAGIIELNLCKNMSDTYKLEITGVSREELSMYKLTCMRGMSLVHLLSLSTFKEYLGSSDEIRALLIKETGVKSIQIIGFTDDDLEIMDEIHTDSAVKYEAESTEEESKDPEHDEALKDIISPSIVDDIQWPSIEIKDESLKVLSLKKALLLQGPPGTGKTKMAEALAYMLMCTDNNNKAFEGTVKASNVDSYHFCEVQFSEEYSYSDFIEGLKPDGNNWRMSAGPFKTMCDNAKKYPTERFVIIIDEINRANTEAVIGEMLNLMEKRDREVTLKSNQTLQMPKNLFIIATMNTVDRGAGTLDFATISRFAEINIEPPAEISAESILTHKCVQVVRTNENQEDYDKLLSGLDDLIKTIQEVNNKIQNDHDIIGDASGLKLGLRSLYTDYTNIEELRLVVKYDIIPELLCRQSKIKAQTIDNCKQAFESWMQSNF